MEFLANTPTGLYILLACFITAFVAVYIRRKNEFRKAADRFRESLLKDMHGIIPHNGNWSEDVYLKFKKVVPNIKKTALEFKPYISWYRQKKYDSAVVDFYTFCDNATWNQATIDAFYNKETETTQKEFGLEKFYTLLAFSN